MANLINLTTNEYPVSQTEADRRIRKDTSCGPVINYAEFGYAVVFPAPTPTHDPITQYVRELAPVLTDKGHYEQAYEVLPLDADAIATNQLRAKDQANAAILAQILPLQQLALRALVEDSDTVWLDKRRADIAVLRGKIQK